MTIHQEPHPLAEQTIKLKSTVTHPQYDLGGQDFWIEDWWDRVAGQSWMTCDGNPACMLYAIRSVINNLPTDNEVVYGKFQGMGVLIHISELQEGEDND